HHLPALCRHSPLLCQRHSPTPLLHSFPTRRSSDLRSRHSDGSSETRRAFKESPKAERHQQQLQPSVLSEPGNTLTQHVEEAALRSEEHTSELQSPDHLVCRLLLEKKKSTSSTLILD